MTSDNDIVDNIEQHRYEIEQNGVLAELVYARTPHALVLVHTEVPPALRGSGVGSRLVEFGVAEARRQGLKLVVKCPFARAHLERHPPSDVDRGE